MTRFGTISLLSLIVFFSGITPAAAGTGDLQVTCEPGVRIFVDNTFKGVSKESDGGLFIPDLTPGPHTVKVLKKGFYTYEKSVEIKEFEAVEVVVKFTEPPAKVIPLSPAPESSEVTAPVGALELRSAPMGATVLIDGEKKTEKTDLRIENIRAGQHTITFQRDTQELSGTFAVQPDKTLALKADFKNNVIVNITALKKSARDKERAQQPKELKPAASTEKTVTQPAGAEAKGPQPATAAGPAAVPPAGAAATGPGSAAIETTKPYGELLVEMTVSRASGPSYRDSLLVTFPDQSAPRDSLLAPDFLRTKDKGGAVKFQTDSNGRIIAAQTILTPRQDAGPVSQTSTYQVIVKEGSYNLAIDRKRWKIDFYSDRKIYEKASRETIAIKRGERLRVKVQFTPDKEENLNLALEKSYEAVGKNFNSDVDSLLKKNR